MFMPRSFIVYTLANVYVVVLTFPTILMTYELHITFYINCRRVSVSASISQTSTVKCVVVVVFLYFFICVRSAPRLVGGWWLCMCDVRVRRPAERRSSKNDHKSFLFEKWKWIDVWLMKSSMVVEAYSNRWGWILNMLHRKVANRNRISKPLTMEMLTVQIPTSFSQKPTSQGRNICDFVQATKLFLRS